MKKTKQKSIDYVIMDWKEVDMLLDALVLLANERRYHFLVMDSKCDSYCVAYSTEKFTEREAVENLGVPF